MPLSKCCRIAAVACMAWRAAAASPVFAASVQLPEEAENYYTLSTRVRQAADRPWLPAAGKLGNLREVRISAADCVVRLVSGPENRVFPGTRDVYVVEQSRVLDDDPDLQPAPRDVALAPDIGQACQGLSPCGVSLTQVTDAPRGDRHGGACFTLQVATADTLLLGGDRLVLLADHLRQPALRVWFNPGYDMQAWFERADLGALSIQANAPAQFGGNGRIGFLGAASSNGASVGLLHLFRTQRVGLSVTTTGTQWSIHIGPDTRASYYQPARAPGDIAKGYGVEVDGPIERLEVPASRVDPRPLSEATRIAARQLRERVVAKAGVAMVLPAPDPSVPAIADLIAALPASPRERVERVVAQLMPDSARIVELALWRGGARLVAGFPDEVTARDAVRRLSASGEFLHVGGGVLSQDGRPVISVQLSFSCDTPGQPSMCPAGDPRARRGGYSEAQVSDALHEMLGPDIEVHDVRLEGQRIEFEADAASEAEAIAALQRIAARPGFFHTSVSGYGPPRADGSSPFRAFLTLTCSRPPTPDGICPLRPDGETAPRIP